MTPTLAESCIPDTLSLRSDVRRRKYTGMQVWNKLARAREGRLPKLTRRPTGAGHREGTAEAGTGTREGRRRGLPQGRRQATAALEPFPHAVVAYAVNPDTTSAARWISATEQSHPSGRSALLHRVGHDDRSRRVHRARRSADPDRRPETDPQSQGPHVHRQRRRLSRARSRRAG